MLKPETTLKKVLLLGFIAAFIYELPFIFLFEDSHIYITDNLDCIISIFLMTVREGKLFQFHSYINHLMNGLPTQCLANGINFTVLWYTFLPAFLAYLVNDFVVHWIAFAGMYLLLDGYVLKNKDKAHIVVLLVSINFCFLPFYSIYGLSIAGTPLLLWAILNLQNNIKKWISYAIVVLFPLYSMLVFIGVFIIALLSFYFFYLWVIKKLFKMHLLLAIITLTIVYALAEFPLINFIFFNKQLISHRTEWNPYYSSLGLKDTILNALKIFSTGHLHAISLHTLLLPLSLVCLFILFIKNKKDTSYQRLVFYLLFTLIFISFASAFTNWDGLIVLKEKITLLKTFQLNRVIWLAPFIWYILFAVCLYSIIHLKYGRQLVIGIASIQLLFIVMHHSEIQYRTQLVYKKSGAKVSYKQFFSEELLKEIKDYINLPQENYRVASLGIHPAVALYSGFYTLDSYQNNYLLSYKHNFRKIIAKELDKSKTWRDYFDYWGNRCYIFSSEIPRSDNSFMLYKDLNYKLHNLQLNTVHFKKMGGRYIFSAAEILNADENNLKLLKVFEKEYLPWRIYLYEAI